jgi:hypothetical protein
MKISKEEYAAYAQSLASGSIVYAEGEAGSLMYLLIEGSIELRKAGAAGAMRPIRLQAGSFFGEKALYGEATRTETAIALAPSRILAIDAELSRALMAKNPDYAEWMAGLARSGQPAAEPEFTDIALRPQAQGFQSAETTGQAYQAGQAPAKSLSDGRDTASLIVGILSITLSWMSWTGVIGLILGVVGIVLAASGKRQSLPSLAVAGLVLSIVGVAISAVTLTTWLSCIICVNGMASSLSTPYRFRW